MDKFSNSVSKIISKIRQLGREKFLQGAAILSITTFLSYVTGLLRDRNFARMFGAGRELDLYNASFIIPDLILNILVSAALSAAFIPIFTSLFARGEKEKAVELGNTILHSSVILIAVFGTVIAIFMPLFSKLIAPGFTDAERESLVSLSRLMMVSPLLMALSSSLGAMLVSFKNFLPYGISPILYNLGIIAGTLTYPFFGIYGLVLGTVFGAALHLLPRIIAIVRTPFKYAFKINFRDKNFIKVIILALPKMIGHPVEQLTFMGFTRIATLLAAGSVTAVSFARNFQSVPVALFGIAFSVAIYPSLSAYAGVGDRENYIKSLKKAIRDILIFTVPSAIGLYFLSDLPIRILLGGGKFTDENILRTASVLSMFALSIPTESIIALLARAFYSLKNTWIPVVFSIINLVVSFSFAYYQSKTMGITAIPLGFFLGSFSEMVALSFILRFKIKSLKPMPLK
ncbi:MAG: murein biosynthesis integral membrane protein MurJ [Candidatus Gracilibacteria bacterium]